MLLFPPLHEALWFGQLSVFLALAFSVLIFAVERKMDRTVGVMLFLFTIKPQLFYLPGFVLILWLLAHRRLKVLSGFAAAAAVSISITGYFSPAAISAWFSGAPRPFHNMACTLVTPFRVLVARATGVIPDWPILVVPAVALLITVLWLRRKTPWVPSPDLLNFLLALSLFTAPYGWFFDFTTLLSAQVILLHRILSDRIGSARRFRLLVLILGLHVAATGPSLLTETPQHYFFWYPAAFMVIWKLAMNRLPSSGINRVDQETAL